MNHTTVGELLERMKVAEPCARVVFNIGEFDYQEFDIHCPSPISELRIIPASSEIEDEIESLKEELEDSEREMKKYRDALAEIQTYFETDEPIEERMAAIEKIVAETDFD